MESVSSVPMESVAGCMADPPDGATIAEAFGVEHDGPGTSFLGELLGIA